MPLAWGLLVCVLIFGGLALVGYTTPDARTVLFLWLIIAALVAFGTYAVRGNLLVAVLVWFITLIAFHEEFWRAPVPLFFSVTIPRIGIAILVFLFATMLLLGRIRLRHAWPISGLMAALAIYFFLSAFFTGFQTRSIVSVHYRLIGGYLFPFIVFGLVLHSFRHERDFHRLCTFFALLSVYLAFTGWCEKFEITSLIFPRFISDPEVGIHFGRVRGPFVMAPAMGLAMCYCFFNNLVLARNSRRFWQWSLWALNLFMLPAIFWTHTRSVWLSFVFCLLIWAIYSQRRTMRVIVVSLLVASMLLVAVLNMQNFLSENRSKGGLTDTEPILLRIGLAQMTWEIIKDYPLWGVGFGHFRDHAPGYARDPSSPAYAFGSTAMEHNNLLSILAETGVIGVILYVWLIVCLLRFSVRLYHKLPPTSPRMIGRDLLVLYWILAAAYIIDGTFRETSDNPFANCLFFGLSAVPVALNDLLSPSVLPAASNQGSRRLQHGGLA
jgi:hypothetical protein